MSADNAPADVVHLDPAQIEGALHSLARGIRRAKRNADKPSPVVLVTPAGNGNRRERRAAERARVADNRRRARKALA